MSRQYLYKNVTSHDLENTLPDPDSIGEEQPANPLLEAYLQGVGDSQVAIHAILEFMLKGRTDTATKCRCIAVSTILFPDSIQYTHGKNIKEISHKYGLENEQAFYSLQKHFKIQLEKQKDIYEN